MNMFKKTGGFTLVELIVVIAILAILAGVAVPAYSGYISKANEAADTTQLAAIKTATMAACATEGTVTKIEVTAGTGAISEIKVSYGTKTDVLFFSTTTSATLDAQADEFVEFYGSSSMPTLKAWTNGAVWYASNTTVGSGTSAVTYNAGEWTAK